MKISKEIQIALVAIIGIAVLFCGLQFLKGLSIYSDDPTYYATFESTGGLSSNCAVYANGYKVGVVTGVTFTYGDGHPSLVKMEIDKRMRVARGSTAEIESDMLGNVQVNIVLGPDPNDILSPGDTIYGQQKKGVFDEAGNLITPIEAMMPKLDSILVSLNTLLADPALSNSLHNVDQITGDLTVTTSQLNTLMAQMNKKVPTMLDKADSLLDNTNQLTANLNNADIAKTIDNVNATLENVEEMTAKLNSNDGTIGLLMRDPDLYRNLANTMRDADSLLIDLKAHPKRYVHFSLFGKKDK